MPSTKRKSRTAKKLVLPLIAVGLMTIMMWVGSGATPHAAQPTNAAFSLTR